MFSYEFCNISKDTFFAEQLWTTASEQVFLAPIFQSQIYINSQVGQECSLQNLCWILETQFIYISQNFIIYFTWTCLSISVSMHTQINDKLNKKIKHILTFASRCFTTLRHKKLAFIEEGVKFTILNRLENKNTP